MQGRTELLNQLITARRRLHQPKYAESARIVIDAIERRIKDETTKTEMPDVLLSKILEGEKNGMDMQGLSSAAEEGGRSG